MSLAEKMLPGEAAAPRNEWYVIAFGNEVTRTPVRRSILGDPIVLYRTEGGTPVALFDRCPHRGMRLSNGGTVIGEAIQCNYHGLQFGSNGQCVKVPSGGAVPKVMRVRRYPLVQVWDWIWIWAGDPEKADPSRIPDHRALGLTDPALNSYSGLSLEMEANYLLAHENLVEATHITFLHHGFVDSGNVAATPFTTEVNGREVTTVRRFRDERVAPYQKTAYGLRCEVVDRELTLTSHAPQLAVVTETYHEKGIDNPRDLIARLVIPVTPASRTKCYQFVAAVRSVPTETEGLFEGLRSFLVEDVVALGDIQQLFDSLPPEQARVEISIASDGPAIRTRRIIEKLISAEREEPQRATPAASV
jgi:phenylpropionate dioxygenase-like ring-hydroxylating dioxygenase large terminal subunit